MKKSWRIIMFVSLAIVLTFPLFRGINEGAVPSASSSAQGDMRTVFGPETFSRVTGKPVGATRVFSIADFEPPFILHVRSNRVSSARIALNGNLILGPSDFSNNVTCFDLPVDVRASSRGQSAAALPPGLKPDFPGTTGLATTTGLTLGGFAYLSVWMAGKPGGSLVIWIEGKPLGVRVVSPGGGRIQFPNGVVLDVPPGAVLEPTAIEIKDLSPIEVNAILNARRYSPHHKHLLGGFEAKPEGLTFLEPVKVTIPVAPLSAPGGIPFEAQIMPEQNRYWLLPTNLVFNPEEGTAEISIRHFSYNAIVEVERDEEQPEDPCKEKRITVVSDQTDFSGGASGECQLLCSTITVTFLDCPDTTPEVDSVCDTTPQCGDNVKIYFSGDFGITCSWTRSDFCTSYVTYIFHVDGSLQGYSGVMRLLGEGDVAASYGEDCKEYGSEHVYIDQDEILGFSGSEVTWVSTGKTLVFVGTLGSSITGMLTYTPAGVTIPVSWQVTKVSM
jgi:hypothetical protein